MTLVREESDQDLHFVLKVGRNHMIAAAPNAPFCTANATALRKKQMRQARKAVRLCAKARVVGVAFFDYLHGQTGVTPNLLELHPILGFACLSKTGPPAPPPPRWRAYLGGDDLDEPAELFFYCPTCAEREFGDELRA